MTAYGEKRIEELVGEQRDAWMREVAFAHKRLADKDWAIAGLTAQIARLDARQGEMVALMGTTLGLLARMLAIIERWEPPKP